MKNILILLSALLTILLCSCNGRVEVGSGKEYLYQRAETAKASDIIKEYKVIPLETTEDNLIMDITRIALANGRIFILDIGRRSVQAFNMDGKYIGKVGKIGEGPGEYIVPQEIIVHESSNQLFIDDKARNKFIAYDLNTLQFTREYEPPFYSHCAEVLGQDKLIWYCGAGLHNDGEFSKHIQVTDMDFKPVASLVEQYRKFPQRGPFNVMTYFSTIQDKVYFHHPFLPDYYSCSEQLAIEPAFSIGLEGIPFPTKQYVESHAKNIVKDLERDRYMQWCDVLGNSNTLLCYGGTGKERHIGVYNLKKDKGWHIDRDDIVDNLGIGKIARPISVYNDYFVTSVNMEQELPENSVLKKYVNTSGEPQSPLLLLFKCQ